MTIPAAMAAEMRGQGRVHAVAEWFGVGNFAAAPIASESHGIYKPYVEDFGAFQRTAGHYDLSMEELNASITIRDVERSIQKSIGAANYGIRGGIIDVWLRSFYVPEVSHWRFFAGWVVDWSLDDDRYSIQLGNDIRPLGDKVVNLPFAREVFPDLPSETDDEPLWVLYGVWSSKGVPDATGMLAARPVIITKNISGTVTSSIWFISAGPIAEVTQIWLDGVDSTANWTVRKRDFGAGWKMTVIEWTGGGTFPNEDSQVTFDAKGLGTTYGGATPITNPSTAARNFLANYVFGESRGTQYFTDESIFPIDTAAFDEAATFFTRRDWKIAAQVFAGETVGNFVSNYARSFQAIPYWNKEQKLALKPDDHAQTGANAVTTLSQMTRQVRGAVRGSSSRSSAFHSIRVSSLYNRARTEYTRLRGVTDLAFPLRGEIPIELPYGRGEAF